MKTVVDTVDASVYTLRGIFTSMIGHSTHCSRSRPFGGSLAAAHVHNAYLHVKSYYTRPCAARQSIEELQQHDVVNVATPTGSLGLMEVLQGWDSSKGSCQMLWKGQLLQLTAASAEQTGDLQLHALGGYPAANSSVVSSFPLLDRVLDSMHTHAGDVPGGAVTFQKVDALDRLLAEVQADVTPWRDGTAPGSPIKSELQQAMFTAGELAALLGGQRGLVLVQLWNGWDASKGQPLYNPCAITMLERVLAAPGIGFCTAVAPQGVGLTGILYADREPFVSWAAHLASFGCQANSVAGSAYYKLLIGQLLGYKQENVLAYVAASGEPASEKLLQEVAADIRKLSKVKPKLPWSHTDANIKKPKKVAKPGGKAVGFGAKR